MKSRKETMEIAVTAVSIIILIFVLTNNLSKVSRKKQVPKTPQPVASQVATQPAGEVAPLGAEQGTVEEQKQRAKLPWGRDPFSMTRYERTERVVDLTLNGIVYDKKNPKLSYALMGEEVVREGDKISDIKIICIKEDRITIEKEGKTCDLIMR